MPDPGHPSPRPVVLVLDDETDIRELVADMLRDAGYHPLVAATYPQALAHVGAFRLALILADPPDDPAERRAAPARLVAAAGDTPVLLFSARDPVDLADWAARGFADVLPKPFDLDELLASVGRFAPAPGD